MNPPKPADINVVWHHGNLISESIEWWTKGPSHAELIADWPNVISADSDGLMYREIRSEEQQYGAILTWKSGLTDEERAAIVNVMWPFIGSAYPAWSLSTFIIGGDQHIPGQFFCSQSVVWAYLQAGKEIISRVAPQFASPYDVWKSPMLRRFEL